MDGGGSQRIRLVKNAFFSSLTALSNLLLLVLFLVAARMLGVDALGTLAVGMAVGNAVAFILDLGLNSIAIRRISSRATTPAETASLLLELRLLDILAFLAVFVPVVWFAIDDPQLRATVLLFSVAGTLRCFNFSFRALLQALERFSSESLVVFFDTASIMVAGLVVLYLGGGPVELGWTFLAVRAATLTFYAIVIRRFIGQITWKANWPELWALQREAFPLGVAIMFSTLYWQTDILMLSAFAGAFATGIFSAAFRIVEGLRVAPDVLANVLYPRLSLWQERSWDRFDDLLLRGCKYMLIVGAGVAGLGAFHAKEIVQLLYGPQFAPSAQVLAVLIVIPVFFFCGPILLASLRAIGKQSLVMWVMGGGVAAKLILGLALIPWLGVTGATIAAFASAAVLTCFAVLAVARYRRALLDAGRWVLRIAAAILVAVGSGWLFTGLPFVVSAMLMGIIYLLALRLLGVFDHYELDLVTRLKNRILP